MDDFIIDNLKRCILKKPDGHLEWKMCIVDKNNKCREPVRSNWRCHDLSPYEKEEMRRQRNKRN